MRRTITAPVTLVLAIGLTAAVAWGQAAPAPGPTEKVELPDLWRTMLGYINLGQADPARSNAEEILARNPEPNALFLLTLREPRSMLTLEKGRNLRDLKPPIDKLLELIDAGYRAQRWDPERINAAIDGLDKGMDAFSNNVARLRWSGEIAVRHMVDRLMRPTTAQSLRSAIVTALPLMGKDAVRPLSAALQTEDAQLQEVFVKALGQISYPHALPRIAEMIGRKELLARTREAAVAALHACADEKNIDKKSVASLYYELARKYYYRAESLLPDPRAKKANVWFWRGTGLVRLEVPREIFCDVYAMRMAALALEHDPKFYPAVSLWLMGNLNKEANLPPGELDPTRTTDQPSARFYALASGPQYLQRVIDQALADLNTPVALAALKALVETAGEKTLVEVAAGGAQPAVEAMIYPDREVQFFAAVSLAKAMPTRKFEGYQMVMQVLNGAIRQTGKKVALLVATDIQQGNLLKDAIREAGFLVLEAPDMAKAMALGQRYSGVDVAVIGTRPSALESVRALRSQPGYIATPVVVASRTPETRELMERDKRTLVVDAQPKAADFASALDAAVKLGAGKPLTPEQAADWSVTASQVIRELGLRGSMVYDITRTQAALIEALDDTREPVRVAAARALAVMAAPKAQRAVAALAGNIGLESSIRIAAHKALSESVRRFGHQLTEEDVKAIRDTALGTGPQALREAAAEVLGALNLSSDEAVDLIAPKPGR